MSTYQLKFFFCNIFLYSPRGMLWLSGMVYKSKYRTWPLQITNFIATREFIMDTFCWTLLSFLLGLSQVYCQGMFSKTSLQTPCLVLFSASCLQIINIKCTTKYHFLSLSFKILSPLISKWKKMYKWGVFLQLHFI